MGMTLRRGAGMLLPALLCACLAAHAEAPLRLIIAFQAAVADPTESGYLAALGARIGCPLTHLETLASGPHVYRCDAPAHALGDILTRLRDEPDIEFAEADRLSAPDAP